MRLAKTLVALLLPLALLGGCGDDDAESEGAGSTTTSSTAPPSSDDSREDDTDPGADRAADQALADSVVLTLDDLGPGWTVAEDEEEDDTDDAEDALVEDELAECLQIDPDDVPDDSDDPEATISFEQETTEIESSASVSPTLEEIERTFALFDSGRFPGCYGQIFESEMAQDQADEEGFTFTGVEVTELDLPSTLGDGALGLRAVLSAEAEGVTFDTYQDIYFVRRGRVGITLMAISAFEPVPESFSLALASIMDERAAAA